MNSEKYDIFLIKGDNPLARSYTKDLKMKACELVLKEGKRHSVAADRLGIDVVMLYRWIDEY